MVYSENPLRNWKFQTPLVYINYCKLCENPLRNWKLNQPLYHSSKSSICENPLRNWKRDILYKYWYPLNFLWESVKELKVHTFNLFHLILYTTWESVKELKEFYIWYTTAWCTKWESVRELKVLAIYNKTAVDGKWESVRELKDLYASVIKNNWLFGENPLGNWKNISKGISLKVTQWEFVRELKVNSLHRQYYYLLVRIR